MIDNIKAAIAKAYYDAYPTYLIRDEEAPNGSVKKPTFYIMPYDFEYHQSLGDRYSGTLYFDDLFFSTETGVNLRRELLSVQESIARQFTKLDGFKVLRQSCEIIDSVLHHKYRITYKELRREDVAKINSMLSGVRNKEVG